MELYKRKMTWYLLHSQLQQISLSGLVSAGVCKYTGANQVWYALCVRTEGEKWDFCLAGQSGERLDTQSACSSVGPEHKALWEELNSQRSVDLSVGKLLSSPLRAPVPSCPKHPEELMRWAISLGLLNCRKANLCWWCNGV